MPFYTKRMVRFLEGKGGKKKRKEHKSAKGLRIAPKGAGTGGKSGQGTSSTVAQTEVQTTAPAETIPEQSYDQKKLLYMKGFLKLSVERIQKEKSAFPIKHRYYARYTMMAEEGPIAEGPFCKVYKAQHQEFKESILAVKVYELSNLQIDVNDSLWLKILRTIAKKHSHIIQTWDIFHNPESNQLLIFQELANKGSLVQYLEQNAIDEQQAGRWSWQINKGLDYLGDIGVTHRDIKPNHILLNHKDLRAKLTDFKSAAIYWDPQREDIKNIACIAPENRPADQPSYQAPEVYGDPTKEEFDPIVADVWSFGATIYYMFTKAYPYDQNITEPAIGQQIQTNVDQIQALSPEGKKLLSEMLKPVATERKHIDKLATDPWLKKFK